MKVIVESPKLITTEDLSQDKCYAIFNHGSFYIHGGEELKSLTSDKDIPLTLPQLQKCIQTEGTHFVAECESVNDAMDLYNSGLWRNFKI